MKYIMMETTEGQKLPFIFPDAINHDLMAAMVAWAIDRQMKREAAPVNAGFIAVGDGVEVSGESESLGGMKSNPTDALRIMAGASCEFMPDIFLAPLADKIKGKYSDVAKDAFSTTKSTFERRIKARK